MRGYRKYEKFCKDFANLMWDRDTPYFSNGFDDFFIYLTPKGVKEHRDCQYHIEKKNEYPLWFIGDAIQGWIVDYMDDCYQNYNDEQDRKAIIFRKRMARLFRKYNIAPEGWIRWYED